MEICSEHFYNSSIEDKQPIDESIKNWMLECSQYLNAFHSHHPPFLPRPQPPLILSMILCVS